MKRAFRSTARRGAGRRGSTLAECGVALIILATAVVSTSQLAIAVMAQQRLSVQRQIARQEAANLMEQIFALPEDQLTSEELAGLALSEAARQLPDVQHSASVGQLEGSPAGRRVLVEVRWTGAAGRPAAPVRLAAWRYLPGEVP